MPDNETKTLAEMRAVAEAATEGPWAFVKGVQGLGIVLVGGSYKLEVINRDCPHIATFDPPTVLSLLDRVERAEREVMRQYDSAERGALLGTFVQLVAEIQERSK
jgi:hypothetical protein